MDDYFMREEIIGPVPETYASEVIVGAYSDEYGSDDNNSVSLETGRETNQFFEFSDDSENESCKKVSPPKKVVNNNIVTNKRNTPTSYKKKEKAKKARKNPPVATQESSNGELAKFLYECSLCMFKSTSETELRLHVFEHLGGPDTETFIEESFVDDFYRCFFCPFKTPTKSVFASHLKKSHKDPNSVLSKTLPPSYDSESDNADSDSEDPSTTPKRKSDKVYSPFVIKDGSKLYNCSYCMYKSPHRSRIIRHERIHTGEKPFTCPVCKDSFNQYGTLKQHIIKQHGAEHVIPNSLFMQKTKSSLTKPVRRSPKKKVVKPLKVKEMSIAENSERKRRPKYYDKSGKFACIYCSYSTDYRFRMVRHERIHTGEKPFACSYCSYRCNQYEYLKVHTRQHTGEKPFQCKLCAFSTTTRDRLTLHSKTHKAGSELLQCGTCSSSFASKKQLQSHEKVHNVRKGRSYTKSAKKSSPTTPAVINSYQCSLCHFKCNKFKELSEHSQIHKAEQQTKTAPKMKYRCSLCGARFQKKKELKSHNKSEHCSKEDSGDKNVTIEVGGYVLSVSNE